MIPFAENLIIYDASDFLSRLRGLLFQLELTEAEALRIIPCKNVHTIGMRYDIDVVFLSRSGEVLKIDTLKPNRWSICVRAKSVLEFKAGYAARHGFKVGSIAEPFITQSIKKRHGCRENT